MIRPHRFLPAILLPVAPWATTLFAHGGHHHDTAPTSLAWSWAPLPLVGITIAAAIYAFGLYRLWRSAGIGRGVHPWQAASFAAGLVALAIALLSPLDTISDQLGSAHMIQHLAIMLIAAPLLVTGSPTAVATWAMPARGRRTVARGVSRWRLGVCSRHVLWQPILLWLIYAAVLWVWHLPALYGAAMENEWIHDGQHLAFLLAAALYWRVLLDPVGRVQLTPTLAVAYLFTTSLHAMLLGVFMAMSQRVWYAAYLDTTAAWNLSALEDQQIAGYIMWMPACAIYAGVAVAILGLWIHRSASRDLAAADLADLTRPSRATWMKDAT